MKYFLLTGAATAGLLLFPLIGAAQDADNYHPDRDARVHDEHWRGRIFEDVKKDVLHVENVTWHGNGDQYRLKQTVDELDQLQAKLANHVYDVHTLDDVIGVLSKVVNDNRMEFRERDMLTEDLMRLREYRKHHAEWSASSSS